MLAVGSIHRRATSAVPAAARIAPAETNPGGQVAWRLDEMERRLLAPDGVQIELSATDVAVLGCLLEASGKTVTRETLAERLGLAPGDNPNLLNATIYRLRRRIERATPTLAPLQAKSRTGYVFRAPLLRA
jgi:DNA-binding response OmpR family regulator